MSHWPWSELGLRETSDRGEIRRAYSAKLKLLDLDNQIDAYADLRDARDEALYRADQLAARGNDDCDLGIGSLDDDPPAQGPIDTDYTAPEEDEDGFEWEIDLDELLRGSDHANPAAMPYDTGPVEFGARGSSASLHGGPPPGWSELSGLLFPGGEHSAEAFTIADFEAAEAALAQVIGSAEAGDIVQHDAIENNLAEMLAQGWPRSAPLVTTANDVFHWLGEKGTLDERAPLVFLNARIEGMRFHDAVEQPGHAFHAAWTELSRPGKPRFLDRLKVRRDDALDLVATIRRHFPELETLLNEERVAYWTREAPAWGTWIVQRIIIVLVVIQALAFCGRNNDSEDDPRITIDMNQGRDTAAVAAFGEGFSFADIEAADPAFAESFRLATGKAGGASQYGDPRAFVRRQILAARKTADFETLLKIQQQQIDWLRIANQQGHAACMAVLSGSFSSSFADKTMSDLEREQRFARQLLEKKLLNAKPVEGEYSYEIPGWLVEQARQRSGLSMEDFRTSLGNPEDANRCLVQRVLIERALSAPSRVPLETLRGL